MSHITFMAYSKIIAPRSAPWRMSHVCRGAVRHVACRRWNMAPRAVSHVAQQVTHPGVGLFLTLIFNVFRNEYIPPPLKKINHPPTPDTHAQTQNLEICGIEKYVAFVPLIILQTATNLDLGRRPMGKAWGGAEGNERWASARKI